jgi:5'-3' exonuclease
MHYLLIDGNSVGHANHNTTVLTTPKGFQTQAVYGFLRTLRLLLEDRAGVVPVVLWDGRAQFRFDLFPDYKGKREEKVDPKDEARRVAYQAQVPFIQMLARLLGVGQIVHEALEADDLAGSLSHAYAQRGDTVTLVSGDKDWLQLVGEKVDWLDPIYDRNPKREVVNLANFFLSTGYYNPKTFLEGKVLRGDSSDCIPGVGGIGEKGAPEFLAAFGSIRGFYDQVASGAFKPKKKAHLRLLTPEGRSNVARNLKLMRLDPQRAIPNEGLNFTTGDYDEDKFITLCGHLAFASILNDLNNFLRPFRALQETRKAA